MLYVTKEQRSRRPIFIATLRAARLLAGCFVAHRSKTTAGILPLKASPARTFAHPAKIRSSATTPVTDLVHWLGKFREHAEFRPPFPISNHSLFEEIAPRRINEHR